MTLCACGPACHLRHTAALQAVRFIPAPVMERAEYAADHFPIRLQDNWRAALVVLVVGADICASISRCPQPLIDRHGHSRVPYSNGCTSYHWSPVVPAASGHRWSASS